MSFTQQGFVQTFVSPGAKQRRSYAPNLASRCQTGKVIRQGRISGGPGGCCFKHNDATPVWSSTVTWRRCQSRHVIKGALQAVAAATCLGVVFETKVPSPTSHHVCRVSTLTGNVPLIGIMIGGAPRVS